MELRLNEKRAICGICPAGCWVIVSYDSRGRLGSVRADGSSPLGAMCTLGEHAREIVYAEHRLRSPLRRKGPKGGFDFEEISWEDAFDEIVGRLCSIRRESGPEAAAIYTGRGSFELAMCDVFQPAGVEISSASSVLFPFGSPNTMGVGALCYVSYAMIAPHVTMGGMHATMFSDIENADLVVVWGANPATDSPPVDLGRIMDAAARGAEVVVIDPRRTRTAKLTGARWIPIRPGTDGALALGLCHVIIDGELYDPDFVRDFTHGFDEFAGYVRHFSPEAVEPVTGVPAETIRWLARRIASARGASPVMYTGLEYSDSGVQAIRAVMVLWALAGQLDVPGGHCFSMPENRFPVNRQGLIANPDMRKALGLDSFPVYSAYRGESHANALPESVLSGIPYRIRSLIILGASIITSWPRPEVWRRTLGALDFLVCIDIFPTADSAYADIVLPAATWYEIESYMRYGPVFRIRERVIEPVGKSRNAFFILTELAERLGYGHLYPASEEALLRHALEPSPFTLEEVRASGGTVSIPTRMMEYRKWEKGSLRPDGRPGFNTPTGRFEIRSVTLEEHGYDPLPVYTEPREGPVANPDLARSYPLVFNSGSRVRTDFRSQFHHIPGLVSQKPEPTVMMNTLDASERGIEDGDMVVLKSPRGEVKLRALVTDDIVQGAVDASMGGGGPLGPEAWQSCNINDLTDLRYDPISGFPIYKALLCEVTKAAGISRARSRGDDGPAEFPGDRGSPAGERRRIYLDHNATTPMHPEVISEMEQVLREAFGNASSIHLDGHRARTAIEDARRKVACLLGCTARRIVFTAGGSEANNLVIKGIALAPWNRKRHLVVSAVEHPSVLEACRWLAGLGFRVTVLKVDRHGLVDPRDLRRTITPDTFLISVMAANNETGAIQPVREIASSAREMGV
ncbi:MAG: aminotransferase class V-fold PLP-dependent enzyme, partial [Desulfomonilia bacterium]